MFSGSIVLYKTNREVVERAIELFFGSSASSKLYIVDNWAHSDYRGLLRDDRIVYIRTPKNVGYGSAHNVALRLAAKQFEFHLVLNTDLYYDPRSLQEMVGYLQRSPDVGLVMPRVVYPDGRPQYIARLLPTPFDLFVRRFVPIRRLQFIIDRRYQLQNYSQDVAMNVPFLSGAFMALRTSSLRHVGLFDERFFMYMEDVDLSRRFHSHYKTVYLPHATICHEYERASIREFPLFVAHVRSAVKYFNKWGWFFDAERRRVNRSAIIAARSAQEKRLTLDQDDNP